MTTLTLSYLCLTLWYMLQDATDAGPLPHWTNLALPNPLYSLDTQVLTSGEAGHTVQAPDD